jgi:flagellum-specific ATP synthase
MLARADAFDTVVVALIGERGREVREFLEDTIGPQGMKKTVAVVATSDESAMMRRRAPDTAMRVAEHFRERGHRVLLLLDSITRFAHALREVATATGEPPVARGYPASVFTDLPKLLERAGPGAEGSGSITAILSVLVDGDDHNDPVADSTRGILDGHIVLSRSIAEQGRYPPVDPLASVSRLAPKAWTDDQRVLVGKLRAMISRYEDTRDIRLLGAYQPGADPELDMAVRQVPSSTRHGPIADRAALPRSLRGSRPLSERQGNQPNGDQVQQPLRRIAGDARRTARCWLPRSRNPSGPSLLPRPEDQQERCHHGGARRKPRRRLCDLSPGTSSTIRSSSACAP